MSDPRIIYDSSTGRWFALAFDVTRSDTVIGFSAGTDPTQAWYFYNVSSGGCPDQPRLAVGTALVEFTDNLFSSCTGAAVGIGGELTLINKSSMIAGSLSASDVGIFGPDARYRSIAPAQPVQPMAAPFLVSVDGNGSTAAHLFAPTSPTQSSIPVTNISIRPLTAPPAAPQPSGAPPLDSGDARIGSAIWDNGTLWFSAGDSCIASGETTPRACARFDGISTSSATINEERELVLDQPRYLTYPTIASDSGGNLEAIFGFSSVGDSPGLGVITKLGGNAGFSNWRILMQGSAPYVDPSFGANGGRNRWGNYFAAVRDPASASTVWVAGEYANGPQSWGTTIAAIAASTAGTVPTISYSSPSTLSVDATSATLTASLNPQGSTTSYHFDYGTTTAYGSSTPAQTLAALTAFSGVSAAITGLAPLTTYHFRLAASNANGSAVGIDQSFTTTAATPPPPPPDTQVPSVHVSSAHGKLGHLVNLNFRFSENSGQAYVRVWVNVAGHHGPTWDDQQLHANGPYYVRWRAPKKRPSSARFCVVVTDAAGNSAPRACAGISLVK